MSRKFQLIDNVTCAVQLSLASRSSHSGHSGVYLAPYIALQSQEIAFVYSYTECFMGTYPSLGHCIASDTMHRRTSLQILFFCEIRAIDSRNSSIHLLFGKTSAKPGTQLQVLPEAGGRVGELEERLINP